MKIHKVLEKVLLQGAALSLLLAAGSANATLVSYTITGSLYSGTTYNDFGLVDGDTITAIAVFDDSEFTGTGTTGLMDMSTSGYSLTIDVNGTIYTVSNDVSMAPKLQLNAFNVYDLDYLANAGVNGALYSFNSSFSNFDDFDSNYGVYGYWGPAVPSAVPAPAAIWLFGSGLIGLAGVVRRRK